MGQKKDDCGVTMTKAGCGLVLLGLLIPFVVDAPFIARAVDVWLEPPADSVGPTSLGLSDWFVSLLWRDYQPKIKHPYQSLRFPLFPICLGFPKPVRLPRRGGTTPW